MLISDISLTPQELWPENATQDGVPLGVVVAQRALQLLPSLKLVLFTGHRPASKSLGLEDGWLSSSPKAL
ncbi:hypothetical protein [Nitrospira sp. Nam74]